MGEVCLIGEKNDRMAFQARANYQKLCHRRAAMGIQFRWWWEAGTISTNLDGIWGMSVKDTYAKRSSGGCQFKLYRSAPWQVTQLAA